MMWRAFEADVYIPFDQFLDEALLPPTGHSGMLYDSRAMRYSLEGYVCVTFPILSTSDTFTAQLLTPQVLYEPTFKTIMQGVTDAMRQVSNLSSSKAYLKHFRLLPFSMAQRPILSTTHEVSKLEML
jgi:hypothetical protein